MGLLGKLGALFGGAKGAGTDDAVHLYVECGRCGSKVHVRLDPRHDLSAREEGGYFVRKEIMDSKCFRLITAEITLDNAYRIQSQDITGGQFITREAFDATPPASPSA
ncbi:MAG TPA: hypothetical protein VMD08_17305 [Candidatus Baltobacteraceae bacterium]|nr:hypothetical protein [Candidatus Baltobacteraceae bacterium]